eukprot:4175380-Amphidinium_carterae.1
MHGYPSRRLCPRVWMRKQHICLAILACERIVPLQSTRWKLAKPLLAVFSIDGGCFGFVSARLGFKGRLMGLASIA